MPTGSELAAALRNKKGGFGQRHGGAGTKGRGWLGILERPISADPGKTRPSVSTEIGVGVEMGGREVEIPSIVPTLTHQELQYLLNNTGPVPESVLKKAAAHAKMRMNQGLSPWAD